VDEAIDVESAVEEVVRENEQHREYRRARVELIKDYAETKDCRRRYLLNYFGEQSLEPCSYCDNCEAGTVAKHEAVDEKLPFPAKEPCEAHQVGRGHRHAVRRRHRAVRRRRDEGAGDGVRAGEEAVDAVILTLLDVA
jgi:superfamily II DNA helicase RecQ